MNLNMNQYEQHQRQLIYVNGHRNPDVVDILFGKPSVSIYMRK
jgi:hypothetical protein